MADSYVIKDQQAAYFFTFQIVSWADLFTRKSYRDIIVDAFNYCIERKNLQVHAWAIMSNHVHCILSSSNAKLSGTVRDFKRHTAKQILQTMEQGPESRREWILFQFRRAAQQHVRNKEFQVWAHESHAIEISPYIKDMSKSKIDYIHNNPVENGLVENAEDYLYSSARDYAGRKGLVKLAMW